MKKDKIPSLNNSFTEFLLYSTPSGKIKVEIFLRIDNDWLIQFLKYGKKIQQRHCPSNQIARWLSEAY
jgi:hypothetical protein